MGLLEQQLASGLLNQPATANPNMLAQALKARQQPRKQLNGQGLLDTAAIGLSPVPVIGDVLGLAADANRFVNEPESRTPLNFGLAALGLIPFVPPLVSAGLGKFAQSQGKQLAQMPTGPARNQAGAIVYHGSPHKFDAFDSSKIGTGEGAQAYGHGLYLAENPAVAKEYSKLTPAGGPQPAPRRFFNGQELDAGSPEYHAATLLSGGKSVASVRKEVQGWINGAKDWSPQRLADPNEQRMLAGWQKTLDTLNQVQSKSQFKTLDSTGNLYKVDLPDEAIAKMLDWDKPLSQQAPEVRQAVSEGMKKYKWPQSTIDDVLKNANGQQVINYLMPSGNRSQASDTLRDFGAPGIRYLDGGSRGSGQGTSNYVVFPGNEGLLKILERQ